MTHITHFTADWFTKHAELWLKRMGHLANEKISILEIGSYEGRSTCWFLENLLIHPESIITCIDTWDGQDTCLKEKTTVAFELFKENIQPYGNKVYYQVGKSFEHLVAHNGLKNKFDIIFIDGDHEGYSALTDLLLAYPLLVDNGWLVFDDYLWESDLLRSNPRQAWDAFASVKPPYLEWEVDGRLVFARKKVD